MKEQYIYVVVAFNVDGDGISVYGAFASEEAAQIKRQFVMNDFGKDAWVKKTRLA